MLTFWRSHRWSQRPDQTSLLGTESHRSATQITILNILLCMSEGLHLRLYNAFIVPVLTYNMGTLTPTEWARLDGFHRRQLRQVIGIRYPEKISSNALYGRCECGPMSLSAVKARIGLFGHVMRMSHDTPAQMAIDEYIAPTATAGWQGRPRTTCQLPQTTIYRESGNGSATCKTCNI